MDFEGTLLELQKFGCVFLAESSDNDWRCSCELRGTPAAVKVDVKKYAKTPSMAAKLCLAEVYSLLRNMKATADKLLPVEQRRLESRGES